MLRREAATVAAVRNLQLQQFPWKCKLGLHAAAAAAAAGGLPDTSIRYKMLARRCNRQLAALSLSLCPYLALPPLPSVSNCNNRSVAR